MKLPSKNKCRTYFRITGNFDPDAISGILQLKPEEQWKIGDYRKNGTQYDFASWIIGTCIDYDVYTENQMRNTISPLLDKVELLQRIYSEFDVAFFLEVVSASIRTILAPGNNSPIFSSSFSVPIPVL